MHKQIAQFPSAHFYANKLETPYNTGNNPRFGSFDPYKVFDLVNSREGASKQTGSKYNRVEVDFIFKLVLAILDKLGYYQTEVTPGKNNKPPTRKRILILPKKLPITIGIITFYRGQKDELTRKFRAFNPKLADLLDINTVDSFQGQERDIVILSCVRAFDPRDGNNSVGFVKSEQRMNVALTRAKSAMFVCINGKSFARTTHWKDLLKDARDRKLLVSFNAGISSEQIKKKLGSAQKPSPGIESQNPGESEEKCPVCLEKFTRSMQLAILSRCGHVFCRDCISGWEGTSTAQGRELTCPLCRQVSESFTPYASGG